MLAVVGEMVPGSIWSLNPGESIEMIYPTVWYITPEVARVVAYHWDFFGPWAEGAHIIVARDAEPVSFAPTIILTSTDER